MSFGLTPACVRRITTPRPQSNKSLLPATSTRMAEPNRSAFGKGVPVPSNVTRISSERAAVEMLSSMHSERNRTINDTKRAKCGVWVASPLQGEGEGEGFLEDNWCAETPKPLASVLSPCQWGEARKPARLVSFLKLLINRHDPRHLAEVAVSLALRYSTAIQAGSACDRVPALVAECVHR